MPDPDDHQLGERIRDLFTRVADSAPPAPTLDLSTRPDVFAGGCTTHRWIAAAAAAIIVAAASVATVVLDGDDDGSVRPANVPPSPSTPGPSSDCATAASSTVSPTTSPGLDPSSGSTSPPTTQPVAVTNVTEPEPTPRAAPATWVDPADVTPLIAVVTCAGVTVVDPMAGGIVASIDERSLGMDRPALVAATGDGRVVVGDDT